MSSGDLRYTDSLTRWSADPSTRLDGQYAFYKRAECHTEGNLMASDLVDFLKPPDFAKDQHNLLAFGRRLLVATGLGIYVSQDLRSFKQAEGSEGYSHALVLHGGRLFSHLMRTKPVISSDDGGL
jgi:hypothetical protein